MAPRNPKDSTETNGNIHPGEKGKGKAEIPRTSSNSSLRELPPDVMDVAVAAIGKISKILYFVQGFHSEIGDIEGIYGLGIRQQARIEELNTILNDLTSRKNQEMARLQDENDQYQAKARQFEREREELEQEQASIDDTLNTMQSKMNTQKEKEIDEAKQAFADKFKVRVKQIKEELEKKIQVLETHKAGLKDAVKKLEEEKVQDQKNLNQQKEVLELDKRSSQSHIIRLESQLRQINAALTVSAQTPGYYIECFQQLWEGIRDVATNNFRFLPDDTRPLDSGAVRDRLSSASAIFKYSPLSTESAVATFLRTCAIQNFLSTTTISIIHRRYFAESMAVAGHQSAMQPMDSILDILSNVPAATSSQQLSWQLTTIDKLDRLKSHSPSTPLNISTEPDQDSIIKEIMNLLHYFQDPTDQQLSAKLSEAVSMAVKLWSALRKDSCRVDFDYDTSIGDWQECDFVHDMTTNRSRATILRNEIPADQLPSKSFVLFPRIVGYFDPDYANPRILHTGFVLPHNSSAIREGLEEIKHIEQATKEFKRSLRRGSNPQSSPVMGKLQGGWPAPNHGHN